MSMEIGTHDPAGDIPTGDLQSFGIMPAKLAGRESGWLDDGDRDSGQAAKLAELVREMDIACEVIMARLAVKGNLELRALARRWQAIRKITQSNQPEAGK